MLERVKQYCDTMIFQIPCVQEQFAENFKQYRSQREYSEYWEKSAGDLSKALTEKEVQIKRHQEEYIAQKSKNYKLSKDLDKKTNEVEYLKELIKDIKKLNDTATKDFLTLQKQKIEEQKLFKRITVGYILALLFSYGLLIAVGLQH